MKELDLNQVKNDLAVMNIPYTEGEVPENLMELIKAFGYEASPILADLTDVDTVDAELGVIVRNIKQDVDDGVYIFTVLHSGQAGFVVVQPGTISRAPLIRKVTGDLVTAMTTVDLPPLMPYDMVQITAHMLAQTFMKGIMESCRIPEEYERVFLNMYMPKFLANVGMYFVGAAKEDGTPMIYEETANMEPMILWRSIQKGAGKDESGNAGGTGETAEETASEEESIREGNKEVEESKEEIK